MGQYPSADDELTSEQIIALFTRLKEQRPPHMDFSLWGPHGQRVLRKVKLRDGRIEADGSIGTIDIAGPPTFAVWELSYATFAMGCIMLDEIKPARLDSYKRLHRRCHERYGPQIWAVLYQADVRAWLEHAERVRRRGQDE